MVCWVVVRISLHIFLPGKTQTQWVTNKVLKQTSLTNTKQSSCLEIRETNLFRFLRNRPPLLFLWNFPHVQERDVFQGHLMWHFTRRCLQIPDLEQIPRLDLWNFSFLILQTKVSQFDGTQSPLYSLCLWDKEVWEIAWQVPGGMLQGGESLNQHAGWSNLSCQKQLLNSSG